MQLQQVLTSDRWEEKANKVLSNFNYKYPDEIDMHDICWAYGVKIRPLEASFTEPFVNYDEISHLKAFSLPFHQARRGIIFLKPELDYIEKKLLLAEEFCHVYAHHVNQLDVDTILLSKKESQAKRMAAYLLMPHRFLKEVFNLAMDQAVLISEIADYFLVDEEFAHYRLQLIFNRKIDAITSLKGQLGFIEWEEMID